MEYVKSAQSCQLTCWKKGLKTIFYVQLENRSASDQKDATYSQVSTAQFRTVSSHQ